MSTKTETATFAAGCFWGVQSVFDPIEGVVKTTVGYTGGSTEDPTYKQVCQNDTGHAEAIEIVFDPVIISYDELLDMFFKNHNPTTLNKQGVDAGTQYRSAIFYHSEEQAAAARNKVQDLTDANLFDKPIVTEVTAAATFYPAEEYHQHYFKKNKDAQCRLNPNNE